MIPDINLLPKLEKERSESNVIYILLVIVALLALAFFAWQYFTARSEVIELESKETNLIDQRDQLQFELESLTVAQGGSLKESVTFVEAVSYSVSPLIDETQRLLLKNAYLREYEFDAEVVHIVVDFETLNDTAQYVSRLTKSQYFSDVQVTSVENTEIGDAKEDETNFNLIPRQSAQIDLIINKQFLSAGGGQ